MCDSLCVFDLLCVHVNCARNDPARSFQAMARMFHGSGWIVSKAVNLTAWISSPSRTHCTYSMSITRLPSIFSFRLRSGSLVPRISMYHPQTVDGRRLLRVVGALGDNPNTVGCRVGSEKLECVGRMFTAGISPQSQYRALC